MCGVVTPRRINKSAALGTTNARRLLAWLLDRERAMDHTERTGVLQWCFDAIELHETAQTFRRY